MVSQSADSNLRERAESLIRNHFDLLNAHALAEARAQLFFPPGQDARPLTVYLDAMTELTPFANIVPRTVRIDPPRPTPHGRIATVWLSVSVSCLTGVKEGQFTVWWFPETDKLLISSKPSKWVLELRGRR